uniref:PKD domain-containing protein n=1 Tax=viral metagenome TaxID=1070528 RepID=A0A6C0AZU5_9ZZZZ
MSTTVGTLFTNNLSLVGSTKVTNLETVNDLIGFEYLILNNINLVHKYPGIVTPFSTKWLIVDGDRSITLPLVDPVLLNLPDSVYDFIVDWGDGSTSTITDSNWNTASHTYPTDAEYTVNITGTIQAWSFAYNRTSKDIIISVEQWGCLNLNFTNADFINFSYSYGVVIGQSIDATFYECSHLTLSNVTDVINLTHILSTCYMFYGCGDITLINNINNWNVSSGIVYAASMFQDCTQFNDDISNWVCGAASVDLMFAGCNNFNNGDFAGQSNKPLNNLLSVPTWISAVYMFENCDSFNQDIYGWNLVSEVGFLYLQGMFQDANSFNRPLPWDTSVVINISFMFVGANNFNQPLPWDTSSVTTMESTFEATDSFNQDLSSWNTSNVTTMQSMFYHANIFNNGGQPLTWDTSAVTDMFNMFRDTQFNQPLPWDTSSVVTMQGMFNNATLFNQDISLWNTINVVFMDNMFNGASAFNQPGIGQWNIDSLVPLGMSGMLDNSGITNSNYNLILTGFDSGVIPYGITLGANNCQATSAAAITARNELIGTYGWTINDIPP